MWLQRDELEGGSGGRVSSWEGQDLLGGRDVERITHQEWNILQPSREFCCQKAVVTVKDRTQAGGHLSLFRYKEEEEKSELVVREGRSGAPARQSSEYFFLRNRFKREKGTKLQKCWVKKIT